jgi:hypothetical protein
VQLEIKIESFVKRGIASTSMLEEYAETAKFFTTVISKLKEFAETSKKAK